MSGDPGSPGFADTEPREVDLAITGMTCASCSARIERKLTRLGTDTNVNLVTEKAHVVFREPLTVDDLILPVFVLDGENRRVMAVLRYLESEDRS